MSIGMLEVKQALTCLVLFEDEFFSFTSTHDIKQPKGNRSEEVDEWIASSSKISAVQINIIRSGNEVSFVL